MYCKNCGAEINDNAVVCVKCGVPVIPVKNSYNGSKELAPKRTAAFVCGLLGFLFWAIPVVGLGVDGALLYSQRGENDWKQQGIEIPVNLKYTIGLGSMLGVFVAAGPDFFFNFKDMNKEGFDKKSTQVGLNLGAGVKLIKHLQIGVNYQIPLGDSFDLKELKDAGVKTKTWQISAAYIF